MADAEELAKKITKQQREFVENYILDMNQLRAALAAKYSPKSAASQASQLLNNPKVQAYLQARLKEKRAKHEINADWFVRRLVKIVDFDPGNAVEIQDGVPRLKDDIPKGALKYMDFSGSWSEASGAEGSSSGRSGKAVSKDRLKAMELLMKLMGIGDGAAKDSGRDQEVIDGRVLGALQRHSGKKRT